MLKLSHVMLEGILAVKDLTQKCPNTILQAAEHE